MDSKFRIRDSRFEFEKIRIRIRDSTAGIRESDIESNKSYQAFLVTPAIYPRVWEPMRLHCAVPVAIGGRGHLIENTVLTFRY